MNKNLKKVILGLILGSALALPTSASVVAGEVKASDTVDTLTAADLEATATSYTAFSDVQKNVAVYAGSSAKDNNGNIQLRSKSSDTGIFTTTSGGNIKSVSIVVGNGSPTVNIYGSHTAYSSVGELFASDANLVGTVTNLSTTYTFSDYYEYVGIRSNNGAIYLKSVSFTWSNEAVIRHHVSFDGNGGEGTMNMDGDYNQGSFVLPECKFTAPEGKTFDSWNTKDDGTGDSYQPQQTAQITEDVTFYAIWKDQNLDPDADFKFKKATDISQIKAGDSIVFVFENGESSYVNGYQLTGTDYLSSVDVSIYNETIDLNSEDACIFQVFFENSHMVLKTSDDKYLCTDGSKKSYTTKNTSGKDIYWDLKKEEESLRLYSVTYSDIFMRFNSGTNPKRFSPYPISSGVGFAAIYKRSSALPKISLNIEEKTGYVGNVVTISVDKMLNITPTSYLWSVDNSNAQIASGQGSSEVLVTLCSEGDATVTLTVNGLYQVSCVIHINAASEMILEEGNYFITNSGKMLGADLSAKEFNPASLGDMWTFEYAPEGDNAFYIKNGNNYLAHKRLINTSAREQDPGLSTDTVDYWTVSKNQDGSYKFVSTYQTSSHKEYAIAYGSDGNWHVSYSTNQDGAKITLQKEANFIGITYKGTLEKDTYNVGDTFDPTGLTFYASYEGGMDVLLEGKITWNKIELGTTATGYVLFGGKEVDVIVNNITVTDYKPESLAINVKDSTKFKTEYFVGESISLEGAEVILTSYDENANPQRVTRTLQDKEIVINPTIVESGMTKFTVSLFGYPDVKVEQNITTKSKQLVTANYVKAGDKIIFATINATKDHSNIAGGEELASENGEIYHLSYDYTPSGYDTFLVEDADGYFALKNTRTNQYLRGKGKSLEYKEAPDPIYAEYDETSEFYSFEIKTTLNNELAVFEFANGGLDEQDNFTFEYTYQVGQDWTHARHTYAILDLDTETGHLLVEDSTDGSWENFTEIYSSDFTFYFDEGYDLTIQLPAPAEEVDERAKWSLSYNTNTSTWSIANASSQDDAILRYNNDGLGKFGLYSASNTQLNAQEVVIYRDNTISLAAPCTGIKVDADSIKTTYNVGDTFEWTGLIVTAFYQGGIGGDKGITVPLGGYDISIPDMSTVGEKTVTVSYGTEENTVTKDFTIEVKEKDAPILYITSVNWSKEPTKTLFEVGDTFEFDGIIRATFNDGSTRILEDDEFVVELSSMEVGSRKVVVRIPTGRGGEPLYLNYTITVSEKVIPVTLDHIEVTGQTTSFTQGDEFVFDGVCTAYYSDGSSKAVLPLLSSVNTNTLGTQTVTVTYSEGGITKRVSYEINIVEKVYIVDMKAEGYTKTFYENSPYSFDGKVYVMYSNDLGNYVEVTSYDVNATSYNKSEIGEYEIVITMDGYDGEVRFTVSVIEKPIDVITLQYESSKEDAVAGETQQLVLKKPISTYDGNNMEIWDKLICESSDESVATVSSTGLVTYVHIGTCTITVRAKNGTGVAYYHVVVHGNTQSVSLDKHDVSLYKGETTTLTATIVGTTLEEEPVTFTSSDETIATVSSTGEVLAKKAGTVTITVTSLDGTKKDTCKVVVKEHPTTIDVSASKTTLVVGETSTLTSVVYPTGVDQDVTYTSSDESIATVSTSGVVTAIKEGNVTITVTTLDGTISETITLTVKPVEVSSISLNKTSATLDEGDTLDLVVTINPDNATNYSLTFISSDTSVATIDENGKVTALKEGSTTITAICGTKVATCSITVTKPVAPVDNNPTTEENSGCGGSLISSSILVSALALAGLSLVLSKKEHE